MPTQRIVLTCSPNFFLSLATVIAIAAASPARSEEYRGTWAQQMACTPDVWRLCSDQVPDVGRIVTCLRQNTTQLSNGCRAVFESNASADQPQPRTALPSTAQRPRATQPTPIAPRVPSDGDDE